MSDGHAALQEKLFLGRSRRRFAIRAALAAFDAVALLAAGNLATIVRFGQWRHVAAVGFGGTAPVTLARISVVTAAIWLFMLWSGGLYDLNGVSWGTGRYRRRRSRPARHAPRTPCSIARRLPVSVS